MLPVVGVGCAPLAVTAEVGYARLAIAGDLSLTSSGGNANAQDIGAAFGLGDGRDCPYGRVALDAGLPEFGVTAFLLRESGSGTLSETFGGIPAGTTVTSDLEIGVARCTGALGFDLGPVHVAPGMMFDVFAIDFRAASSPGNREEVDDVVESGLGRRLFLLRRVEHSRVRPLAAIVAVVGKVEGIEQNLRRADRRLDLAA